MKLVPLLFWIALLAAIAACGPSATLTGPPPAATQQQPTVTPKAPPPRATPAPTATVAATHRPATATPAPTVTPTEPLLSEIPKLRLVEIPPDHTAAPIAMLPGDSLLYAYINIEAAAQRPTYQEQIEFALDRFVGADELLFAEELLVSVGTRALALSTPYSIGE